jgi:polysaccharide export outer membrane protein
MRGLLIVLALCAWGGGATAQELQPGDTIAVSVYQDPKLDRQIVIGPNGSIAFPLAGQIKAEGLTPQALEKVLRAKLKDKYAGALDITVSVVAVAKPDEEQRPRFYITGEVNKPGPYVLRSGISVVQAIAMSGGLGQFAARKRIQVRRKVNGVESTILFDYAAFEAGRDSEGNVELQPGDVIIVPEKNFWE